MVVLSLFDGISATQVALRNLGIKVKSYYSSEIDNYAIQITQKNFPNTIQLGDVKKIGYDFSHILLEDKPEDAYFANIDLLVAGFPCQDLSSANKDGNGLDGARSGLFYELLRIIEEAKPKHVLIESVASMKKEWKEKISQELGFGFTEINSALLTAQQRRRCYWVAKLQEDGTYKKIEIEQPQDKGILLKDIIDNENSFVIHDKNHFTLKTTYRSNLSINIANNYKMRTLTCRLPTYIDKFGTNKYFSTKELCQLQGFPVNYFNNERQIIHNRQDAKALGNSFTVPVIEHILKAIFNI